MGHVLKRNPCFGVNGRFKPEWSPCIKLSILFRNQGKGEKKKFKRLGDFCQRFYATTVRQQHYQQQQAPSSGLVVTLEDLEQLAYKQFIKVLQSTVQSQLARSSTDQVLNLYIQNGIK